MTDRQRFDFFQRKIQRLFDESADEDSRILIAALAFELDSALGAAPDDFFVTVIADPPNVTDAEIDAENAWNGRLAALFLDYLK